MALDFILSFYIFTGLASIQDPKGPLRHKDDDLVTDTILERASDWTSSTQLLLALLKRLLTETTLPFANQVIIAALKNHQKSHQKWVEFLDKNLLNDVSYLFKLLVFWSRNIWKRSKSSEDNCNRIRTIICHIIQDKTESKSKILKLCTQNLMNMALNNGTLGFDQATCSLVEEMVNSENSLKESEEDEKAKKKPKSDKNPLFTPEELKLYDALACVVLSTKNSKQPWALETLAKVLKKVVSAEPSVFTGCNHADFNKILPEMAQLQWTLSGNMADLKHLVPSKSAQFLAVLTVAKTAYVANSEGFTKRLIYSGDEPLIGLVWSHSDSEELLGYSASAIYIWELNPMHGGDPVTPVELHFNFGQSTFISSVVASSKNMNGIFILATNNGQVCTHSTELTPLQVIPGKFSSCLKLTLQIEILCT